MKANPCKECLVRPSCNRTCEEFILYLTDKKPTFKGAASDAFGWTFTGVAQMIRMGHLELCDNDIGYRWRKLYQ